MARRSSPEVNAGSMADIAFLLLIFFLVTTTIETDSGISRKLPPMEESEEDVVIKQKNIFTVLLNGKDQLLVEDELMVLEDLRESAIEFLDNGGGTGEDACTYCKGKRDPKSSDNPDKAIISLKNERETSYAIYISVQNELVAAYTHLRNIRAQELYGESYSEMMKNYKDVNWPGSKEKLKENISDIPAFIYSERESKREELRPFLTTALKVDKETNMGIVGDIKQELRKVNALKINYTTRIGDVSLNKQ